MTTFTTLLTTASFGLFYRYSCFIYYLNNVSIVTVTGFCAIITIGPVKWQRYSILSLFELVSLMVNGSIACLIIVRIVYHQHFLRKIFGNDYGSEYTKIMSILIESASLTLILNFLHIILAAAYGRVSAVHSPANMIIIKLIVQVNARNVLILGISRMEY